VILFVGIFLLGYISATYYVGSRLLSVLPMLTGQGPYSWLAISLLAATPFFVRIYGRKISSRWLATLTLLGDYWLAVLYYLTLLWLATDAVAFFMVLFTGAPPFSMPAIDLIVPAVTVAMLIRGTMNARTARVNSYQVAVAKDLPARRELRAVLVSDIHLGTTVNRRRLEQMVQEINRLAPDIVFLAGDVIDGNVEPFAAQGMAAVLRQLQSPLGVYAVMGNHEYMSGQGELAVEHLQEGGVTVLRDAWVEVAGEFYVVGRDDRARHRLTGKARLSLEDVMQGLDATKPIILLDHQPWVLAEAQSAGVDLQLSGHTHHGQFFPNNLVTQRLFELDWGYLQKGALQVVVSCGYATWGPPIRIGSYSEIVELGITFGSKS